MSQAAAILLLLNLWAVLVWFAAAGAARRFAPLAAWPAYWLGAFAVVLAPPLLAAAAPSGAGAALAASLAGFLTETAAPAALETANAVLSLAAPAPYADFISFTAVQAPAASSAAPGFVPAAPLPDAGAATAPWMAGALAVCVALYALGAALALTRLVVAHARIRMMARRAAPLDAAAPWPVRATAEDTPPCALGFPAPLILVPAHLAARLEAEELAMILRHEAAHIGRRDPEATLALGAVEALFWPNPSVRALARRWRLAAEIAADEAVAADRPQAERARYARLLVSALRGGRGAPLAAPSAALRLDGKGAAKLRLAAILDAERPRADGGLKLGALLSGAALALVGAAGCAAVAQTPGAPVSAGALAVMAEPPSPPARLDAPVPIPPLPPAAVALEAEPPAPPAPPAIHAQTPPAPSASPGDCGNGAQVRVIVERIDADGVATREESVGRMPDPACIDAHVRDAMAEARAAVAAARGTAEAGRAARIEARRAASVMSAEEWEEWRSEMQALRAELSRERAGMAAEIAAAMQTAAAMEAWAAEFGGAFGAEWAERGARWGEQWGEWGRDMGARWNRGQRGAGAAPQSPEGVPPARILEGGPDE